jgi:hypothetical protein
MEARRPNAETVLARPQQRMEVRRPNADTVHARPQHEQTKQGKKTKQNVWICHLRMEMFSCYSVELDKAPTLVWICHLRMEVPLTKCNFLLLKVNLKSQTQVRRRNAVTAHARPQHEQTMKGKKPKQNIKLIHHSVELDKAASRV